MISIRPLIFIIYIDDLDNGVKSKLFKFADDTKLGGEVDSRGGGDQIQESFGGGSFINQEVVLTLYRNLVRATSGILCAVLVTTVPEGHRCHRDSGPS